MNKRKSILDLFSKQKQLSSSSNEIIITIYNYYKIYDLDKNTTYAKAFKMLYMDSECHTYCTIAKKNNIALSTLKRYAKNFERLAIKILSNGIS